MRSLPSLPFDEQRYDLSKRPATSSPPPRDPSTDYLDPTSRSLSVVQTPPLLTHKSSHIYKILREGRSILDSIMRTEDRVIGAKKTPAVIDHADVTIDEKDKTESVTGEDAHLSPWTIRPRKSFTLFGASPPGCICINHFDEVAEKTPSAVEVRVLRHSYQEPLDGLDDINIPALRFDKFEV